MPMRYFRSIIDHLSKIQLSDPRTISTYFVLVGISTALLLTLRTYVVPNSFVLLDWPINYQMGFIRRGLVGEFLLFMNEVSGLSIALLTLFLTIVLYVIFLCAAFKLISAAQFTPAALLLIYSPYFLNYQISSWSSAGRKEIAFLAFFAVICLLVARTSSQSRLLTLLSVSLLLFPLLVLTHEALALSMAWIWCLAIMVLRDSRHLWVLAFCSLPSVLVLGYIILLGPSSHETVVGICASLQGRLGVASLEQECVTGHTPLFWLPLGVDEGMSWVRNALLELLPTLPPALLLVLAAFLPFIPVLNRLPGPSRVRLYTVCLAAWCISVPTFVVAIDWGRFVYLNATAMGLLFITVTARAEKETDGAAKAPAQWLCLAYLMCWSLQFKGSMLGGGFIVDYAVRLLLGHR